MPANPRVRTSVVATRRWAYRYARGPPGPPMNLKESDAVARRRASSGASRHPPAPAVERGGLPSRRRRRQRVVLGRARNAEQGRPSIAVSTTSECAPADVIRGRDDPRAAVPTVIESGAVTVAAGRALRRARHMCGAARLTVLVVNLTSDVIRSTLCQCRETLCGQR